MEPINTILGFLNPASDTFFLKVAFVPSQEFMEQKITGLKETVNSRLPIIGQISDLFSALNSSSYIDSTWEGVNINFGGKYGLGETQIINPTFINFVAPKVKFWLSGLMIFCTAMWTLNRFTQFLGG